MNKNKKRIIIIVIMFIVALGIALIIPLFTPIKITNFFTGYEYTVYSDYVVITGYNKKESDVKIPDKIYFRPVKEIGYQSFQDNSTVENVIISDSVETIDIRAFQNCKALKSVKLGKNVKEINISAFGSCDALEEVILNEKLTQIGVNAFNSDKKLKKITITKNVKFIGTTAFALSGIEEVIFNSKDAYIARAAFDDTSWITKEEFVMAQGNTLLAYNGDSDIVVVPEGIKNICGSFYNSLNVKEIYLPDTVQEIQSYATPIKSEMIKVYIPDSVTVFGIDKDSRVFDSTNTTIITTAGSYAEQYAKEQGIKCELVDHIEYPTE